MALIPSFSGLGKAANPTTILLIEDDPFQAHAHRTALERHYASVERAADASEAFIRVDEPEFQQTLALVVVGLRLPGVAGPAFVSELISRMPQVPMLVIGRPRETASDYSGKGILFLPAGAPEIELLAATRRALSRGLRQVA